MRVGPIFAFMSQFSEALNLTNELNIFSTYCCVFVQHPVVLTRLLLQQSKLSDSFFTVFCVRNQWELRVLVMPPRQRFAWWNPECCIFIPPPDVSALAAVLDLKDLPEKLTWSFSFWENAGIFQPKCYFPIRRYIISLEISPIWHLFTKRIYFLRLHNLMLTHKSHFFPT